MALKTKAVSGNAVRIPEPEPGEVTVISRYGRERAMLIHPIDFHRLQDLDRLLGVASELDSTVPSHDALAAHREEDMPGKPITDPAQLADIFG
jgi:hypothetical protein